MAAKLLSILCAGLLCLAPSHARSHSGRDDAFSKAVQAARDALEAGDSLRARREIQRALERDPKSLDVWKLRAEWALAGELRDEEIYARHKAYRLAVAQRASKSVQRELLDAVMALDPIAADLFGMKQLYLEKLAPIADKYEKGGRPHAAIRVHKKILALDPENVESQAAIERIAAQPDPSLAAEAKPRDLFEGVSEEWIRDHDEKHASWGDKAERKTANYTTQTSAGYVVLIRASEAMEQMNAFYREFFQHGTKEHGGSVPPIHLKIFRTKDEYLKKGSSPVEWSGGQFTGTAVETYIAEGGGFEGMTGTLFHEAAHQFVSLATRAAGWLNEGLASFFEGTRILPNGTVVMNLPAGHRLAQLARRMRNGWMADHTDGIDPKEASKIPERAPSFRVVLENRYEWGPPWYAPTWGVVYFLYNYQDPVDGRFVYRNAFREFVDKSGGRVGEGAVKNFEEVVLGNPEPPFKGVAGASKSEVALPKTVDELNEVWGEWILALYDAQAGPSEEGKPYKQWAIYAADNGQYGAAMDHFEKGLIDNPGDTELLLAFADLLDEHFENPDRAARLALEAIGILERAEEPDQKAIDAAEKVLAKLDPGHKTLAKIEEEMSASALNVVQRYQGAELPLMVMDVSQRLGRDLHLDALFEYYEDAYREAGDALQIWNLAYNESNFDGWNLVGTDTNFKADGDRLVSEFGRYDPKEFNYRVLTLDTITSGDFSLQADVEAKRGELNFAGFAFGRKGPKTFHGFLLFPGKSGSGETANTGFVDLTSFFGDAEFETWRHLPVSTDGDPNATDSGWHTMRLDVSGRFADIWYDGELIASHEFASADVLRGSFGIMCGNGRVAYRNIRFLERDPRDPAAQIERRVKIEDLMAESGGAIGGSYLGRVPPWPEVDTWVQGERAGWEEKRGVPQLLVLFSIPQNNVIAIDAWLRHLAKKHAADGLEVVCIASPNDKDALASYLESKPFPGAVGIDSRSEPGIGDTNTLYSTDRFNLPRLILLDVDGKVAWEGDPGISSGERWSASKETFLDTPLRELISKRNPSEFLKWREQWSSTAVPALRSGDLDTALPVLTASRGFDRRISKEVSTAQLRLAALEGAFDNLEATAQSFQREGAEAALEILASWAPALERSVSKRTKKQMKAYFESPSVDDWTDAQRKITRWSKNKKGTPAERAAQLIADLKPLEGRFVADLVRDLEAAVDDEEAFRELAERAEHRPREWLIGEYFSWGS